MSEDADRDDETACPSRNGGGVSEDPRRLVEPRRSPNWGRCGESPDGLSAEDTNAVSPPGAIEAMATVSPESEGPVGGASSVPASPRLSATS